MNRKFAWFAVIVLSCVVAAVIVLPVIQESREQFARSANQADLKRIMLALHNYHDKFNSFPPAFIVGPDGKRWHSWRALVLKDLDPVLAAEYRWDEPWDGPSNSKLHDRCPDVFQRTQATGSSSAAGYFAVVGKRTMWPADQALRLRDILDGSSNTIALVEDDRTDIIWLQPRDMLTGELFRSVYRSNQRHGDGGRMLGLADGEVRFASSNIERSILAGLLTPQMFSETYQGTQWPSDLLDEPTTQMFGPPRSAEEFVGTEVVPIASEPIQSGINQLWCISFQLSWNQLKQNVGGDVVIPGGNRIADALNQYPVSADVLSSEAVFFAQTDGREESDGQMLESLHKKFPSVDLSLSEFPDDNRWRIRLLSVIKKQMPFEAVFDRFNTGLQFRGAGTAAPIKSFGHRPGESSNDHAVYPSQVKVLDDLGDHDFIIQLNTVGPQSDQIILAHIEARESLQATWDLIRARIKRPNPQHVRPVLQANETLQVPIMDFSLTKRFSGLEGPVDGFRDPASIAFAVMEIRLRLDETGADFMSAGEMGVVGEFGEDDYDPQRVRNFIFDQPFFVALKEPQAEAPYFMAWIANGELMESFFK